MPRNENNTIDLRQMPADAVRARESNTLVVHWEAEEFTHHEKNFHWFLVGGIVLFGVFAGLVILKNIFGAAVILLFSLIIFMYAAKKPDTLSITIDGKGVTINGKTTPYADIASFWVLYEPPVKELVVVRKEHFTPQMLIPLGSMDPVRVREALAANAVPEKEEEEHIADIIARRMRF